MAPHWQQATIMQELVDQPALPAGMGMLLPCCSGATQCCAGPLLQLELPSTQCFTSSQLLSSCFLHQHDPAKANSETRTSRSRTYSVCCYTESGGVRPFGVSLLLAGVDENGPQLYQIDPSGSYFAWKASAIGKNMSNAKTFLEKRCAARAFSSSSSHRQVGPAQIAKCKTKCSLPALFNTLPCG